jgi:peptide/nickel transport system permease protein
LSFVFIQLPRGDLAQRLYDRTILETGGAGEAIAKALMADLRDYLGLDKPMHVRYVKWMWKMMHGDLGRSFNPVHGLTLQKKVKELIGDRLMLTVALAGFTIMVTWTLAIPVGIYSAVRQHSVGDYVFTFLGFTGLAVPDFLLALVLMYVSFAYFDLSVGGLFSADYQGAPWDVAKVRDLLNHLWLPAVVLGTSGTASLIRIMRNNLLDELSRPYVVTARAKGMGSWRLVMKYPVRVAINPLISTVGYLLPALVSGGIIVWVVLSLPTLGPVLLNAIMIEDLYTAGFIIMLSGVLIVIGTLISDILLAVVDPRIRLTNQ